LIALGPTSPLDAIHSIPFILIFSVLTSSYPFLHLAEEIGIFRGGVRMFEP
jgi:hypothetical protein